MNSKLFVDKMEQIKQMSKLILGEKSHTKHWGNVAFKNKYITASEKVELDTLVDLRNTMSHGNSSTIQIINNHLIRVEYFINKLNNSAHLNWSNSKINEDKNNNAQSKKYENNNSITFDENKTNFLTIKSIELGVHPIKKKTLSWTILDRNYNNKGISLLLCDEIIDYEIFHSISRISREIESEIFTNNSLIFDILEIKKEKNLVGITLLSKDEFDKYKPSIKLLPGFWALNRLLVPRPSRHGLYVCHDGSLYNDHFPSEYVVSRVDGVTWEKRVRLEIGVRPALLIILE